MAVFEVIVDQSLHAAFETLGRALGAQHFERRTARYDFERRMQRPDLFEVDILRTVQLAHVDAVDGDLLADLLPHRQNA